MNNQFRIRDIRHVALNGTHVTWFSVYSLDDARDAYVYDHTTYVRGTWKTPATVLRKWLANTEN